MTCSTKLLDGALLADAAYIDFSGLPWPISEDQLRDRLIDPTKNTTNEPRFSLQQAEYFSNHWQLVYYDDGAQDSTGFVGAVFQRIDNSTGTAVPLDEFSFAFRGTEFFDLPLFDVFADAAMAVTANAANQTSDMEYFVTNARTYLADHNLSTDASVFSAAGHSLGGHLTQRAVAKFDWIDSAYTLNGMGSERKPGSNRTCFF